MLRFVLASQSASRLGILRSAGFDPEVIVSGVEEDFDEPNTATVVLELARRKAHAVAKSLHGALVIGCDSLLDVDGVSYGKPVSIDEARARWQTMRGHSATLMTGHCLINTFTGAQAIEVVATAVHFANPTDAELEAYLATKESLGSAGGFTLEGRGAPFVDRIEGDALNVMGISPACIARLLVRVNATLTDVWPLSKSPHSG